MSVGLLESYGPEKLLTAWCALADESKKENQNEKSRNLAKKFEQAIRKYSMLNAQQIKKYCDEVNIFNAKAQKYEAHASKSRFLLIFTPEESKTEKLFGINCGISLIESFPLGCTMESV